MFRREKQGAVEVIRGHAPFNDDVLSEFADIVEVCLSSGDGQIVVDLSHVSLISSAGLEALVDLQIRCLRQGGAMKISSANDLCSHVLRVTGVEERIELFPDAITAAGSFAD